MKKKEPNKGNQGLYVYNLTVTYRNGYTALHDASFYIPTSSIAALVGINGSGKSTLFKAIMGFIPISCGQITIFGKDVKSSLRCQAIAYVPQTEEIDWSFPVLVEDAVMMGRYGHMNFMRLTRAEDEKAVSDALKRVDMTHFRHRQIGELSGGQKKRVFLARALAQKSQGILLDEPFTGIDVKTERSIIELLCELREEGALVLIATHNLGNVPEFCDQTVLIKGTILDYGPTSNVFTQENLENTFGGLLRRFVLSGTDLHKDEDSRQLTVISDGERPFVVYDTQTKRKTEKKYD
ncbi:manganese/iron ABC transporter ATP-binding protein [Candidatus Endowatersipora endosymbiont of Watersipora subatra]|uniref:manganese/iron ABC transporter ATP-binding protein n=1 Tax=Candidatus Endowatersipora endosymbiont of Watersipora subatra TaxID=3077946 RepID=UPI00312CB2E9